MTKIRILCLLGLLGVSFNNLNADLKMPAVFSDNMVLQRDMPVNVWGDADPNEEISLSFGKSNLKTVADKNGKWIFTLAPLPASKEPAEMTISGKNKLVFKNILMGDVWLCSGQSNMEAGMSIPKNATSPENPLIRNIKVKFASSPGPQDDFTSSGWGTPDVKQGEVPVVGYFFAVEIVRETGIPIGIIHSSKAGSGIDPWISGDAFRKSPALGASAKTVAMLYPKTQEEKTNYLNNIEKLNAWITAARQSIEADKAPPLPPQPMPLQLYPSPPTTFFNAMIYPLAKYPIRGVLWYQGEANSGDKTYNIKMAALINGWRDLWQQKNMPFYFVQLPNLIEGHGWAYNREGQLKTVQSIPNTGMAVTIDIGDKNNIHPNNKKDVAKRLAAIALNDIYGKKIPCLSPFFKDMKIEGNKLIITFDNAGSGLCSGSKKPNQDFMITDEAIREFKVAGADKIWQTADSVVIDGKTLIVSSSKVAAPVAVRYAFSNAPEVNLYNREGFPVSPFRTDSW